MFLPHQPVTFHCALEVEVDEPFQHQYKSWEGGGYPHSSCLILVSKMSQPKEFRPVALTPNEDHGMATVPSPKTPGPPCIRPTAVRLPGECVGIEDAILYMLHRAYSHLDKGGSAMRIMVFDFSSAFNTIQPHLLRDKLLQIKVDLHLVTWITDCLTKRSLFVRLGDLTSETVVSSTGAWCTTGNCSLTCTVHPIHCRFQKQLCIMLHAEVL